MHISDINQALSARIGSDIENAFKALVGWPGYDRIEGSTANQRKDLLLRVCEALRDNPRQMPGHILDLVREQCEGLEGGSYDDGARAVRGNVRPFLSRLGQGGR